MVIYLTLYLDLIFFLNFCFDFILLLSVSIILRRNVSFFKVLLGSLLGAFSIFFLFFSFPSLQLFIFKVIVSIIMILITFGYKDFMYTFRNLLFLYMNSIILGGFLYYLNIEFSYKQEGLIFYHQGLSINYIILVIISPIIIYTYIRQSRLLKVNYSDYYEIELFLTPKEKIRLTGFLDTGNKLIDPLFKKPIILINENKIKINDFKIILIPYYTIANESLLKCIRPYKIKIKGLGESSNLLVGLIDKEVGIDGVNCLLNKQLMEEIK